jgi:hypothetical protein
MKRLIVFILAFVPFLASCQTDKTFKEQVTFEKGIKFVDGTTMITATSGTGIVDWASVTNKPTVFPPSVHGHDALYKPISYAPTWAEITNKPAEIELMTAIPLLDYLPIPSKTTVQINALVMPAGSRGMIWDSTIGVLKVWNGLVWKIYPTTN